MKEMGIDVECELAILTQALALPASICRKAYCTQTLGVQPLRSLARGLELNLA